MIREDPFLTKAATQAALDASTPALIDREGEYEAVATLVLPTLLQTFGKRFVGREERALQQKRVSKTSYVAELWSLGSEQALIVFVEGPPAPRTVSSDYAATLVKVMRKALA